MIPPPASYGYLPLYQSLNWFDRNLTRHLDGSKATVVIDDFLKSEERDMTSWVLLEFFISVSISCEQASCGGPALVGSVPTL